MNDLIAVVLTAMLMTFVLGLVGLLVFWQLARSRRATGKAAGARYASWRVIVGWATIVSALLAVATYVRG